MAFGSLLTGVTGLRTNQQTLDVVGNNLANSNTTGFKTQRTHFADLLYETLAGPTAPTATFGGNDPIQVGFGAKLASIDNIVTQGALNPTGRALDAALQGDGFFVVRNGPALAYTRDGSFNVNNQGFLVDPTTGFFVLRTGTVGEATATAQGFQTPGDTRIKIPYGAQTPGSPTTSISFRGNLSATAAVGASVPVVARVFDARGAGHDLTLTFTKAAANRWTLTGSLPAADGTLGDNSVGPIEFGDNGTPTTFNGDLTMTATFAGAAAAQTIAFNLGTVGQSDGLIQTGSASTPLFTQNGLPVGALTTVSIGRDGVISGVFDDTKVIPLAQLAVAHFVNPAGLSRDGNNLFSVSAGSGTAQTGAAQSAGRGAVIGGSLEASNVDVATEFTQLIVAQLGFQVNSRGITVSSEILQDTETIIR